MGGPGAPQEGAIDVGSREQEDLEEAPQDQEWRALSDTTENCCVTTAKSLHLSGLLFSPLLKREGSGPCLPSRLFFMNMNKMRRVLCKHNAKCEYTWQPGRAAAWGPPSYPTESALILRAWPQVKQLMSPSISTPIFLYTCLMSFLIT